jgi:isocitrate dehydrogenase
MPAFNGVPAPTDGQQIRTQGGVLQVPDNPVIPFIEGDGTGPDIWAASQRVLRRSCGKVIRGQAQDHLVRDLRGREVL